MNTLKVNNPFDGQTIAQLPVTTESEVHTAISGGIEALKSFRKMPAYQRAAILTNTAHRISEDRDELAQLITRESGKPLRYARGEVSRSIETFGFAADEARRIHGETIPMDAAAGGVGKIGYYVREPVGVIAAITPFNFPLNLVAHKVAPAVAAGCPIVLKPSPMAPLTALRLLDHMRAAGLPEGMFQIVIGDADVGKWLTTDERVAMLTFTGSYPVARQISQAAGVRRTTFELGGNAATIIDAGTPITDALIERTAVGSFAYSGQVCISVQRLYIHESLYDEFRTRFIEHTQRLRIGDPADADTEIGPLINSSAVERIQAWIDAAVEQGAHIATGGRAEGAIFLPTVLENVKEDMQIMCAEAFGPIVNLLPYRDLETVFDQVNNSEFGLQAGIYTPDLAKAMQAVERLDVGGVIVNDIPTFRVDQMPYGGNKHSGIGREGPRFAVEEMTTLKMVVINPTAP